MKKFQISPRFTPRDSRSLESYLHEIAQIPLLTIDEEVRLAQRIHNGDENAVNILVISNLRFVVSVAKRFLNNGLDLPDLISAGNIGLIKAAKRFDETRGIKFCSYAVWWINQSIHEALNKESRTLKLPANKIAFLSKISKQSARLEQKLQHAPSLSEVTESMGEDESRVSALLCSAEKPLSLDAPLQNEEDLTRMDTLADPSGAKTDDGLMRESLHYEIENFLSILPERERNILKMFFGIGHPHPFSLGEIATHMRLSQDRVRHLHCKALRFLKGNKNKERLRGYL